MRSRGERVHLLGVQVKGLGFSSLGSNPEFQPRKPVNPKCGLFDVRTRLGDGADSRFIQGGVDASSSWEG